MSKKAKPPWSKLRLVSKTDDPKSLGAQIARAEQALSVSPMSVRAAMMRTGMSAVEAGKLLHDQLQKELAPVIALKKSCTCGTADGRHLRTCALVPQDELVTILFTAGKSDLFGMTLSLEQLEAMLPRVRAKARVARAWIEDDKLMAVLK